MGQVITSGQRHLSLESFLEQGARAVGGFAALGVCEGQSVALMMRNDLAMLVGLQGASLLGAYAVPINWHFTSEETGYILRDCDARLVIAHADLLPRLENQLPEGAILLAVETPPEIRAAYGLAPDACTVPERVTEWEAWLADQSPRTAPPALSRASMIYTSGTTGRPKGVRRQPATPQQQEESIRQALLGLGLRPGANAVMTGPMYHSAPLAYARVLLSVGGNLHLMPRFEPEALLAEIEARRLTHMHMVPTMFVRLLALPEEIRRRYDLSSLECVIHGAAPCPPEVKRRMIDWWGPVIDEYYGSTEAGLVTRASADEWLARPGTVGRPLPGREVRVLDDAGREQPPGIEGEIFMSIVGLTDFTYHKRDDERAAIDRDGLISNGDVGYLDEDGYLFLCDRKRDMLISGGVNIYPAEIEAVLHTMPEVSDCAVFGIPDAQYGEVVAAAVAPRSGAALTEGQVTAYLAQHLAAYKLPRLVTFHESLPREDSGKIYKRKLREPYWADAGRRI